MIITHQGIDFTLVGGELYWAPDDEDWEPVDWDIVDEDPNETLIFKHIQQRLEESQ